MTDTSPYWWMRMAFTHANVHTAQKTMNA
jgi:hypothetical protein